VLNQLNYAIAMRKDSPYKHKIDVAIQDMKLSGELLRLWNKWWLDRSQCEVEGVSSERSANLFSDAICGAFYLLGIVAVIALCIAFVDMCIGVVSDAQQSGDTYTGTLQKRFNAAPANGNP